MRRSNNNYYPQGYLGKIAYHAANSNTKKILYFVKRHKEVYGDFSKQDIQVLEQLIAEYRG
jgi:hypothetical protein